MSVMKSIFSHCPMLFDLRGTGRRRSSTSLLKPLRMCTRLFANAASAQNGHTTENITT